MNSQIRYPARQMGVCISLLLLLGCSGSAVLAEDPPEQAVASATGEYLIGPGDTLEVFVWRQPDLSVTVPVRPDGKISTPLVEDVVAVGKTPSQLAREIETVLSEYIRTPEVNIIVQGFVGTFGEQIRVIGQAAQPRAIPYRERMTLMDAIIEAGGLTEFAAGNRSKVVRTVDGKSKEIRVRLDDLINKGKIEENIAMLPGDVIIIPQTLF
jgi:polysaccharide export outer membrane protein